MPRLPLPTSLSPEAENSGGELARRLQRFTVPILLGMFCLCFLAGALRDAGRNVPWMDEVLAIWVARLPTYQQVWSALFHGAETSPPTYDLLLHTLISAGGASYLLLRLPSILAILVSGLCLFALLRRYLDVGAAAYGMVFSLLGIQATYAIQARPYALVVACFMGAVLSWDRVEESDRRFWRVCTMAALLAFASSLHFYAVLFVPCMGAMELLWWVVNRRIRISVWLGLLLAGLSTFAWLPLMRLYSSMNAVDALSVDYYAKPTPAALVHYYAQLAFWDKKQILFFAATLCVVVAVSGLGRTRLVAGPGSITSSESPAGSPLNYYVITFCIFLFPLLVFVFALLVTKTFNLRYVLAGSLGFSCLIAYALGMASAFRWSAGLILLAACPFALMSTPYPSGGLAEHVNVVKKVPQPYPIVIGEGRVYFELEEAVPGDFKSRLVYVNTPPRAVNPDITNEHLLQRWHQIRPDLNIENADDFFARNPRFYLFHTASSTDVITKWLLERHLIVRPVSWHDYGGEYGAGWLFEAEAPQE